MGLKYEVDGDIITATFYFDNSDTTYFEEVLLDMINEMDSINIYMNHPDNEMELIIDVDGRLVLLDVFFQVVEFNKCVRISGT